MVKITANGFEFDNLDIEVTALTKSSIALTKKSKNHSYAPELINKDHPEASSAILSIGFFAPTKKEKDEYS